MAVYTQSERESFIRRCPWRARGWMVGILLSGSTPDAKTALRYQHPEMDGIRAAVDARNRESTEGHDLRHNGEMVQ